MSAIAFAYLTNALWVFPALRQFRTRYNVYFILIATAGLLSLVFWKYRLGSTQNYFYLFFSFLSTYSFKEKKNFMGWFAVGCIAAAIPFSLYFINNKVTETIFFLLAHLIIMITVFRRFVLEAVQTNQLKIFQLLIVAYELSLVIRSFYGIIGSVPSIYYYYTSIITETVICVVFSMFTEQHKLLLLTIRNRDRREQR